MPPSKTGRPASGGTKLQRALDARDLTQADLARAIGVPTSAMSQICTGKRVPHPGVMAKVSRFLKAPVDELFDFDLYERSFEQEVARQRAAKRPSRRK